MDYQMKFPDTPNFRGYNQPLRLEVDLRDLEVMEGAVPTDINGNFYRASHDPLYPPMLGDDIFVNGDGVISMFHFENGHVDYKCRYVRTERYLVQEKARRSLFGVYRNRYTNDPSVKDVDSGTANTTPVWHGKKLLALKEDSFPWELDPHTLETVGKWDFDGDLSAVSMTAHPKIDYQTGEMCFFSYQAKGDATTDVVFYIADREGKIVHETWFNAPYPGLVHDFAVTEEHVIFPFYPLTTDLDVLKAGGHFYQWDGELDTWYAILPKRGTAEEIRWFKGPSTFAAHMLNAFTEDNKVHLDVCLSPASSFPFFPRKDGQPFNRETSRANLVRVSFDLNQEGSDFTTETIFPHLCEMPRNDDRYQMRKHKVGYVIWQDSSHDIPGSSHGTTGIMRNSIARIDFTDNNSVKSWYAGERSSVQEPVFVPRSKDAPEGDGYMIGVVDRLDEMRSDFVILDAQTMEQVALLKMPIRQRQAAHGWFISEEALKTGYYD